MTAGLWTGRQLLWTYGGSGICQRLVNPTISSFGLMAESPADRKEASRKLAEAPPGRSACYHKSLQDRTEAREDLAGEILGIKLGTAMA